VRAPAEGFSEPAVVYGRPEDLPRPAPLAPEFSPSIPGLTQFEAPSPVDSHWPASQTVRGRAFGPEGTDRAVLVLHAAYENDYTFSRWIGTPLAKRGYRVLIPAAPCHLDRKAEDAVSGAPMFWSSQLTVAGIAQWLVEIRALMDYLRGQGVRQIGVCGYSIGSLVAGLAATLYDDLDFNILVAPVGDHLAAIRRSRVAAKVWPWMSDIPAADVELLNRWAPDARQPVIEGNLFLITLCDELSPTSLQQRWWNAWAEPPHHTYRRGHLSILFCRQLYRDLGSFAVARTGGDE